MADHSKDGFGMLYEAAYCRALNNLAKKTSARSESLMGELPNIFKYDAVLPLC
jgi:hypothetical protein